MTGQVLLSAPPADGTAEPESRTGRPPRRPVWRFALLAYVLPVAATVLATRTWFTAGRFVAAGDVPPFLRDNLASELTGAWSHQSTGAGSTSTPVLQLLEVVLLGAVRLLGGDATVAQWLFFALCFGLCTFGAAYLTGAWARHPVAVASAGLLATFNVYLLTWLANPLPALVIGVTGLLAGMACRAASGRRIPPIGFAAATLLTSYLALNPPWLLMCVLTVLFVPIGAAMAGGRPAVRRTLALLLPAAAWSVLFNLWWIVPFAHQLLFPAGTAFAAVTDIRAWAWTHRGNTAANVVTLRALWVWSVPDLLPFYDQLAVGWRAALAWALPALAVTGLLVAGRRRRSAWLSAGVGLVLLFLSTGVRSARIGWINLWMYDHVPGMWLIRDPSSKLGVPLVLLYAGLAGLAVDRIIRLAPRMPVPQRFGVLLQVPPRLRAAGAVTAVILVVLAAIAYPLPMWTGTAVPDHARGDIPSSRVAVPAAWHRLADAANAAGGTGKALVLPLNLDDYAVSTDWGYRGVDIIPMQLLHRPTLNPLPGGYFADLAPVRALLLRAQRALLAGDHDAWQRAVTALGVDTVVVRHDVRPASFDLPVSADPDRLDAALSSMPGVRGGGAFGVGSLFHVDEVGAVTAGRAVDVRGPDDGAVADQVAALGAGEVAVTAAGLPATAFRGTTVASATMPFTLAASGPTRLTRPGAEGSYRARVVGGRLVLDDADAVTVDGRPLPSRPPLTVALSDPDVAALDVGGRVRALPPGGDVVPLGPATVVTAYAAGPGSGLTGAFRPAADCGGEPDAPPAGDPLRLSVRGGHRCAVAPVQATGGALYRLRFSYRETGGVKARACLWQDGPARCAVMPALPAADGLRQYESVVRLGADVLSARLYLYAEATGVKGTAQFTDVTVTPLRAVGSGTLTPQAPQVVTVDLAAGRHETAVTRAEAVADDGALEFEVCDWEGWDPDRYPTGSRPAVGPGAVLTVFAPKVIGCAETAPAPVEPGAVYRVEARYRTEWGITPKLCVRELPSRRCADTPALTRSGAWQSMQSLVHPLTGTTGLQVVVQQDANDMVPGRSAFRDVRLTRVVPVTVEAAPVDASPAVPAVRTTAESASRYRVGIRGASGRFTLAFADSYAPGWVLDDLPAGWTARHVTVDGYANGWLVEGSGDADLTVRYAPQRWTDAALVSSLLAGLIAVAVALGGRLVRRARRRRVVPDTSNLEES